MSDEDPYVRVYQTWELVRREAKRPVAEEPPNSNPRAAPTRELRERVQEKRIFRGWSVRDLATHVHCDAATLAEFERGGHLSEDLQRNLIRILQL